MWNQIFIQNSPTLVSMEILNFPPDTVTIKIEIYLLLLTFLLISFSFTQQLFIIAKNEPSDGTHTYIIHALENIIAGT